MIGLSNGISLGAARLNAWNPSYLFDDGTDGAVLSAAEHDGNWTPEREFRTGTDGAVLSAAEHEVA